MKFATVIALFLACATAPAMAEVKEASADHFHLAFTATIAASPTKVYALLPHVEKWWSAEHTWSGDAAHLSLKPEAGGCFCERWQGNSVEHGRVIMALKDQTLRLDSALGPLQEFALKGILDFGLTEMENGATEMLVDYRVNGSDASGLDQFAPAVDEVLGMQLERLLRYIDTGNPEAPVVAEPEEAPSKKEARAELIEEWAEEAAKEMQKPPKPKERP
ncbi:hypothetical protein [Dokdonella sp.]|uniref:hypothetical protein n=1 Tax=Dokdonella sp. TaxID=2291710 RepID=UPI0035273BAB